MSTDNEAAMRAMYSAMSTGDLDALDKVCHPDFVDHDAEPGQGPGLQGVKESFAGFRAAIPDMAAEVHDLFSAGDKVVARVTLTGTHTGSLGEIPASGNEISVNNIDIIRFEGGVAVERWGRADSLAFMQQLGVIPSMG
jgi:predicted ester cyclase